MFGIASNQQIDPNYMHSLLSAQNFRKGIDSAISYNEWFITYGKDIFKDSGITVVSDADIYNFEELSRLVDNVPQNDAHLLAMLYLKFGPCSIVKLRGVFSFCVSDKRNKKLIVTTDRYGIKPIVYYWDEKYFIFGQRIKTVLSALQSNAHEIDYEAVVDYLNFEAIPTPKTIYKQIRKLPPGYYIIFDCEKKVLNLTQYYDISYNESRVDNDYFLKNIPLYIEDSVKTIVKYELSKGRRVGAFLSGGTDSSTVTGMIKKLTGHVKTFSIGFDEPGYNELKYARIAAEHFDADHHEYIVKPEDVLKGTDTLIEVYDEPFGNASTIPAYFCALLAKEKGVDTLIAGDGGDEIFGGNERYAKNNIFRLYQQVPSIVRKGFLEIILPKIPSPITLIDKAKKYIRRANIPQPDRFFSYNPVMALGKDNIFSVDLLKHINGYDPIAWARELYTRVKAEDELNKLLYIDMKFTITDNDIRKITAISEEAGIRVGYPLLDYKLVDFVATIPPSLKVKGGNLRYIFKEALRGFLPEEVIKKKKHGFGLPIGVWIKTKNNINNFVRENLNSPGCIIKPFFKDRFIDNLFKLHNGTESAYYGDIIWLLLVLELWSKSSRSSFLQLTAQ